MVNRATAICDPVPLAACGLRDALGDGAQIIESGELRSWATGTPDGLCIVSVVHAEDWQLISAVVAASSSPTVVSLLDWASRAAIRRALDIGVAAALPRSAKVSDIVGAIGSVKNGFAVVPREAAQTTSVHGRTDWSEEDRAMLESLARGRSVSEMAATLGYSRRTAARRLRVIYDRLGASGASQATAIASRLGIIR